jgi:phosphate:Na+ symporter
MGLVFFGLAQMGAAVQPLEESGRFAEWMARLETPLVGVAAGAITTLVLQSSSATVGIAITLASQGLLSLPAGVAVMLGAEIGTCADTLVSTLGRSREALRAGVFHLLFNVATVAVGLALVGPLAALARALGGDTARQVANAHVAFNVLGVLAAVGLLGPVARGLERLIPSRAAGDSAERTPATVDPVPADRVPAPAAVPPAVPGRPRGGARRRAGAAAAERGRYSAGPADDRTSPGA